MDAAWIILDSLSFEATPFCEDGPDTMPNLESLANERGAVFTRAYSPGPTSPSSHGSFFTGKLPSKTGMHEASPYYSGEYSTIIEELSDTHDSFLVSANPFIFNGLDRDVKEKKDLVSSNYIIFDEATNPKEMRRQDNESNLKYYLRIIFEEGKPLRSFINGASALYQSNKNNAVIPKKTDSDHEMYQYASEMNEHIRRFDSSTSGDSFVIANYMDIHAPLDASEDAISRFSEKSRDELPIGVRGQDIYDQIQAGNRQVGEDMFDLYLATIFDTDRKISGLIREMVENDTFVIVTADHGNWFRRERDLEERRIHVPLIIFSPELKEYKKFDKTVNLRSMPRTTIEAVQGEKGQFGGNNLLTVEEDQLSITEFIHDSKSDGSPVTPTGSSNARYDFSLIKGESRLDHIDGKFISQRGNQSTIDELKKVGSELLEQNFETNNEDISVTTEAEQRLEKLGYLE